MYTGNILSIEFKRNIVISFVIYRALLAECPNYGLEQYVQSVHSTGNAFEQSSEILISFQNMIKDVFPELIAQGGLKVYGRSA